jgi:HK97 family phage prohead protease
MPQKKFAYTHPSELKLVRPDKRGKESSNLETRHAGWVTREHQGRAVAYTNLEVRAYEDKNVLSGYAAVFDSPSEPMPFIEFVRRGAFAKTLNDGADVRLLIDHEGVPLARTKSGTMSLEEDERGLKVEAQLDPANPDAMRVLSAMRRGDMSQMSFAFRTIKDSWSNDRSVRELKEVQLYDVSIVTFPAYEETVAELRSRNQTAMVDVANSLLIRKNQLAIAKHKQSERSR